MTMTCPHCNAQTPDDSRFCQHCGTNLTDPVAPKPSLSETKPLPAANESALATDLLAKEPSQDSPGDSLATVETHRVESRDVAQEVRCSACGAVLSAEALYCHRCGTPVGAAPAICPLPRLLVVGRDVVLEVPDKEGPILIGRMDVASGIIVDIDLTPYDAKRLGVSRNHCRLTSRHGHWELEDLHTKNFTLLNRRQLMPGYPVRLKHNDQLELGNLILRFLCD